MIKTLRTTTYIQTDITHNRVIYPDNTTFRVVLLVMGFLVFCAFYFGYPCKWLDLNFIINRYFKPDLV